jgi:GTPase SAR1 family protein
VRAVVLGACGSGKTSLFNKLCNKNYPTGYGRESKTRDIDFEDVAYVSSGGFRMYDTPGTDSVSEALHHALILRASLTTLPINLIIVTAKLDNRYFRALQALKDLLKIFKGNEKLVLCMLTHLDELYKEKDP